MEPTMKYDETSDTLTIVFESGMVSTGIELTNNIFLRVNPQTGQAVSLNLFDYSVLSQKTDTGTRSFPLTGLNTLSDSLKETVLNVLHHKPVNDLLDLSAYTPSLAETIPVVSLKPILAVTAAA